MSGGLQSDVLVEETHSGGVWTLLMIPAHDRTSTALGCRTTSLCSGLRSSRLRLASACAAVMWTGFSIASCGMG